MEEEFIELINQYQGILQKICNIYFYQHPFREDYYQEILIRLWKAYPKFKQESTVSTWLYRVTLNTAIDLVRKESVQPVYKELSTQEYAIHDSHPEENTATDKKEQLYQAINRLSEIEKAIIILYLESYEYKEIAAVIGISGGLDSCLALLVAVRAMKQLGRPARDVLAVTMPCFGTTKRTRSNAEILCDELQVSFKEIDIANTVRSHFADIGQDESVLDVTFENGQARVRTLELMDTANRTGGLVVGTGDLSELALGWATYNGDHMSMYGVNAGVPKTLVRHLVRYEADIAATDALRTVLLDILDTPVSPELLPAKDGEIAQKTEDLVGPYELPDFYLYQVLRFGFGPAKIFRLAKTAFAGRPEYPDSVLYKWLRNFYWRFFAQQFKRSCLPDGPKVGSVTLSPRGDWRMPSDACAALWLAELEQLQIKD